MPAGQSCLNEAKVTLNGDMNFKMQFEIGIECAFKTKFERFNFNFLKLKKKTRQKTGS